MKLDMMDMLYALSMALDAIEKENVPGARTGHGKRVGYLCYLLGKKAGFEEEELREFVGCAILHDNALAEYIRLRYDELGDGAEQVAKQIQKGSIEIDEEEELNATAKHCIIGERRMFLLPFHTNLETVLLYHHENADGSGPLGKNASETTLKSQIIRLSDRIDVTFRLETSGPEEMQQIKEFVRERTGIWFSEEAVNLLWEIMEDGSLAELTKNDAETLLRRDIPVHIADYTETEMKNVSRFFAEIVDYKSSFTKDHSMGVARLAERMAEYYHFDEEKRIRYYYAGAMHDIGKLLVPNDILEKPGKLDKEEFDVMKHHASATYEILSRIHGLEDVTLWAANHHEKLNGTGYPRGLQEEDLSFEERLMACIDIYQALTEDRPYKKGMSQEESFAIIDDMVAKGQLDGNIIQNMKAICCG